MKRLTMRQEEVATLLMVFATNIMGLALTRVEIQVCVQHTKGQGEIESCEGKGRAGKERHYR